MVEQHGMNFVYVHSILIKILLLDYLHEFFAESKLMDKSCFYSRGFCQHYNVKKFQCAAAGFGTAPKDIQNPGSILPCT